MSYPTFFEQVAGRRPFPYQAKLGLERWPTLLDVPTGLGKTAAVLVAWLYKCLQRDKYAGARLVYCLPMRVLVEQTKEQAAHFCEQAGPAFAKAGVKQPTVHVLMGGALDERWEGDPENPAILIGTQDMLLSRALNRGYAMSRYRWPMHFALLNNDCTWVFDETQMMGVGVETSAQLAGLRQKLKATGAVQSLWMSATIDTKQLQTVDHPRPTDDYSACRLSPEDLQQPLVQKRVQARKALAPTPVRLDKASSKKGYATGLAEHVLQVHGERGGLTLVVVNRVERARELYRLVLKADGRTAENTALVHSRFRSPDRKKHEQVLLAGEGDRIVIATQAVEAGVDVSARTLVSELAPWPSLVQRFGRCNRYGEASDVAEVHWVDIDTAEKGPELALPYEAAELDVARALLSAVQEKGNVGPAALRELKYEAPELVRPVIRRRDIVELFDTTPDLAGNDLDVSRYIRDGDDNDVQFFWRAVEKPDAETERPRRDELCRVGVVAAKVFLKALAKQKAADKQAYRWDGLTQRWQEVGDCRPGQVLLLPLSAGGYSSELGWTGEPKDVATEVPVASEDESVAMADEALDADPRSSIGRWVSLRDHLSHVRDEARTLAAATGLPEQADILAEAGLWHDVGKAHPVFQQQLLGPVESGDEPVPTGEGPWAKSACRVRTRAKRSHFRHELASALAYLAGAEREEGPDRNLVAYLVAAHHGKVRMSLRSVPGEKGPEDGGAFARGVWQGDRLPALELPGGLALGAIELDLAVVSMGPGSWLERAIALRSEFGPFRLAYLETLVRAADWRASRKEQEGGYDA